MNLGKAIKKLRWQSMTKQTDLAISVKMSNTYLSAIERQAKIPTFELASKIAKHFKIKLSELIALAEIEK